MYCGIGWVRENHPNKAYEDEWVHLRRRDAVRVQGQRPGHCGYRLGSS